MGNAEAGEKVIERLYPDLRRLAAHYMRSERRGHTLQPTALVNELYVKIVSAEPADWRDRAHFLAAAATKLRWLLVDHARRSRLRQRIEVVGCSETPTAFSEVDALILDEAMERLAVVHSRACRVVELRFFGGLNDTETAEVLHVSIPTVRRDFRFARAWLSAHLNSELPGTPHS
jgi:RNA polymerase sigma factor (TIGR02999 family)